MEHGSEAADLRAACDEARAFVAANPNDEAAAEILFASVDRAARDLAGAGQQAAQRIAPEVAEAARLLEIGAVEEAEVLLRRHLVSSRNDPEAMLLMADIATRCGFPENGQKILRRSVELHPTRVENWVALAKILHHRAAQSDQLALVDEALVCLDSALSLDLRHEEALGYRAALLVQVRRLDEGLDAYERLVRLFPESSSAWVYLANLLKTLGRFGEAVAAYRTAIALDPTNAAAWWLLSDLKLARFFEADISRMETVIQQPLPDLAKVNLHFALAAAFDQAKDYARAADNLRQGNSLRLALRPHDIRAMKRGVDAAIRTYSPDFFSRNVHAGEPDPSPIFVVGMPRSGSTLVEQILASHSAIEGTEELFAVQQIEVELIGERGAGSVEVAVGDLPSDEFRKLGRRYLDLTRFHRRTDRERFTDKNPGNWRQVGLIHTILPHAKIIDIRRNPLDCCFANYSQNFLLGVNYSYGFNEVASQYGEYVRLMRHFDAIIPSAVHRIIYEDLVDDAEAQVRRLFDYLELPFEEACLRFFDNDRPVYTPSSEQVRKPINRAGIGKWTRYAPWLKDLENALGNLRHSWRA